MKSLDIVRTPNGSIGFITETNDSGKQAVVTFIGDLRKEQDRNAWWGKEELEVIDSIPCLLANATAHPFGRGKDDVKLFFDVKYKGVKK